MIDASVTTLPDLWREYTVGLNGYPSIRKLYEEDKCKKDERQRKHYSRRQHIYKAINILSTGQDAPSPDVVVKRMEGYRINFSKAVLKAWCKVRGIKKVSHCGGYRGTDDFSRSDQFIDQA
jgi:hypothetical protein